jgi:hypothetical protein
MATHQLAGSYPTPTRRGFQMLIGPPWAPASPVGREKDTNGQRLQLMVDAWHAVTFDPVPAQMMHEAMLVIPEYRLMLADDCLPSQFRHERA